MVISVKINPHNFSPSRMLLTPKEETRLCLSCLFAALAVGMMCGGVVLLADAIPGVGTHDRLEQQYAAAVTVRCFCP